MSATDRRYQRAEDHRSANLPYKGTSPERLNPCEQALTLFVRKNILLAAGRCTVTLNYNPQ
ncbi:MAG: hypothetical protein QOC72_1022 [Methylobacteriaceae bacterium]|nr:hypothetical protein [Methylobacteriaceae bacterium]